MNKLFLYSSLLKCWCYARISFLQIVKFAYSDDTPLVFCDTPVNSSLVFCDTPVNGSLVFCVGPCCSS